MIRNFITQVGTLGDLVKSLDEAKEDKELQELYNTLTDKKKDFVERTYKSANSALKNILSTKALEGLKKNPYIKAVLEKYGDKYLLGRSERLIKTVLGLYVFDNEGNLDINSSSKLEKIKNPANRKKIRDNMIIDIIEAIVNSPFGSGRAYKPGLFESLKRESLIHKILQDKNALESYKGFYTSEREDNLNDASNILESLRNDSDDDLLEFYEEFCTLKNPYTVTFYGEYHYNLMLGNDLIGGSAVASSNHLKLQHLPEFKLKKEFFDQLPYKYKGKTYQLGEKGVNRIKSPITGKIISDLYAEVQAAAPDNGKNPVLGYLGIGINNLYFINYLIALGMPLEDISNILIVYRDFKLTKSLYFNRDYPVDKTNNKYLYIEGKLPDGFDGDIQKAVSLLISEDSSNLLQNHGTYIRGFLNMIESLLDQAKQLNNISAISRVDSPNGALAVFSYEAIVQRLKAKELANEMKKTTYPFVGLDKFIDINLNPEDLKFLGPDGRVNEDFRQKILSSNIPIMQAMYSLGIIGPMELASRHLIGLNSRIIDNVLQLCEDFNINIGSKLGSQLIKNYIKYLPTFLLSYNKLFGDLENLSLIDKSNYYTQIFPVKFYNDLSKIKNNYPNLRILHSLLVNKEKGIILNNALNISKETRELFKEDFDLMLKSGDPYLKDLAIDLYLYNYYRTGSTYKYEGYDAFFSTYFLAMMGDYLLNLHNATNKLTNNLENKGMLERYTHQFICNNIFLIKREKNTELRKAFTISSLNEDSLDTYDGTYFYELKKENKHYPKYKKIYITNNKTGFTYKLFLQRVEKLPEGNYVSDNQSVYYKYIFYNKTSDNIKKYRPFYNANLNNVEFNRELPKIGSKMYITKLTKEEMEIEETNSKKAGKKANEKAASANLSNNDESINLSSTLKDKNIKVIYTEEGKGINIKYDLDTALGVVNKDNIESNLVRINTKGKDIIEEGTPNSAHLPLEAINGSDITAKTFKTPWGNTTGNDIIYLTTGENNSKDSLEDMPKVPKVSTSNTPENGEHICHE